MRVKQKTIDEHVNVGSLMALADRLVRRADELHVDSTWTDDNTSASRLLTRAAGAQRAALLVRDAAVLMAEHDLFI